MAVAEAEKAGVFAIMEDILSGGGRLQLVRFLASLKVTQRRTFSVRVRPG